MAVKIALPIDKGAVIQKLMTRFYHLGIETAYTDAADVLGVGIDFSLSNPAVQRVVGQLAGQVRGIADSTREEIQGLIGQQADEGWSIEELASRIEELGAGHSRERARLIARTESAAAYSKGSLLAYQESGVVAGSEWLTSDPCPICDDLDGKVVPLGDEFMEGVTAPPAHPACKCAVAPVLKGRNDD